MIRISVSLLLAASLLSSVCFAADAADRVFRNGRVFTSDSHSSIAEAIAIRGGRIVYVGSNDGVAALVGPSTKVTDLAGGFVMPGLVDGHMMMAMCFGSRPGSSCL